MILRLNSFLILLAAFSSLCQAQQPVTVFKGRPSHKVSEGGNTRLPETLLKEKAVNLECVISRIGSNYYWASRENKLLVRIDGGAFITFLAPDAAGYVRIIAPGMKSAVSAIGGPAAEFEYVEHLLLGLSSVTYWGKAQEGELAVK